MSAQAESDSTISARDRRTFRGNSMPAPNTAPRIARAVWFCRKNFARSLELKGEVALVGGRGRFEIWNLQQWKRAQEEETPTYQHVANVIGL